MMVKRYDAEQRYDGPPEMFERPSGEYVKYEDFERVLSAFRAFFDAVESDISDMDMVRQWSAIEDARKVVDQYE